MLRSHTDRTDGPPDTARLALIGLGAAMALYVALALWLTRGTTVFVDEIRMFIEDQGLHPHALLTPFNEHLELARRLLYAVGFRLFGADSTFVIARCVEALSVVILAAVVFSFLRRRLGSLAALAPTVLLLFFGSAWELNFVLSGIGNVIAMAAGVAAMMLLEQQRPRMDLLACALLIVSVVSFTTGLAFTVGALCLVALLPGAKRRMWVVMVPIILYGAWLAWIHFIYVPIDGETQQVSLSNLLLTPNMIAQQGSATAGALTGLNYNFRPTDIFSTFSTSSDFGGPLAVLALGLLLWRLRRPVRPMLWALLAVLLIYWAELALGSGPGRNPTTIRYVFATGTLAILVAGEALAPRRFSARALWVLAALIALALCGNILRLRDGMQFFRDFATTARAQLTALEIAQGVESPDLGVEVAAFTQLQIGSYLAAVRRNGSPAFSPVQLAGEPDGARQAADTSLVGAEQIRLTHLPAGTGFFACRHQQLGAGAAEQIPIQAPGVAISSHQGLTATLRRFGTGAGVSVGALSPGQAFELRIRPDRSTRPWRLGGPSSGSAVTICELRPGA